MIGRMISHPSLVTLLYTRTHTYARSECGRKKGGRGGIRSNFDPSHFISSPPYRRKTSIHCVVANKGQLEGGEQQSFLKNKEAIKELCKCLWASNTIFQNQLTHPLPARPPFV